MRKRGVASSLEYYTKRASVVYEEFGLRELIMRVLRRLGFSGRQLAQWRKQKMDVDAEFDRQFGTDTGGVQQLADQEGIVGEHAGHGVAHIATDPSQFTEIMQTLNLLFSEFTFVDLGCGKGRALVLAAQYPFKKIMGVDFVPSFVEAARNNIGAASAQGLRDDIEAIVGDATQFDPPSGAVLIYLYNPFDSEIVRKVALHLRNSYEDDRRPLIIVYANPIHLQAFTECGWRGVTKGSGWVALSCSSS